MSIQTSRITTLTRHEGSPAMSSDDEILSPGFFDHDAQRDSSWLEWSRPERIAARVDALFADTLPLVPNLAPMPDAGRYSDEMLEWLADAFEYFFPDVDALDEPDNNDLADRWVCYIGEALRTRAGGEWFNADGEYPSVLYQEKFTPAIGYRWGNNPDDITDLLYDAVEADGGPDFNLMIGSEIYSREIDFAREHGIPHAFDEVRKQHGLA